MPFNHDIAEKVCTAIDPYGTMQSELKSELTNTRENLATFFKQKGKSFANDRIYDSKLLENLILLSGKVIYEYFENFEGNHDSLKFLTQNLQDTSPEYLLGVAINNLYFGLDSIQDNLIGNFIEEILE